LSESQSNHMILWGPHNADRLSNGHTMIADSRNDRILEVDMLGNVVWELNDSHVDLLWPRDCDILPNGNLLIADSLHNRIIEVNSTFDIVWEYLSSNMTYEADRIDLTPPTLNIFSPRQNDILNNTVMIDISSPDIDTDTIWYRFWNGTSSNWVDLTSQGGTQEYQIYDGNPNIWLLEEGDYVLWVWANDTGYPMLGSDQHINIQELQINFKVGYGLNIIKPSPNQAFNSTTFEFEIILRIEGTLNETWYTLDEGLNNYTFNGLTGTIKKLAWVAISEGYVTIRFYANNSLGAEIFNEVTVLKDITPPLTNISFIPYSGTSKVLKSTLFTLIADDGYGSGIALIKYKIGDGSWIDYTTPFNLSDYTFGNYIISFYAIDTVNNTESIKSISIKLVDVKSESLEPIIIFIIAVSISSVATTGAVIFYILRKKLIARNKLIPEPL
ncbi:MAG: OmpL47-type beta-barrel domain-containing protein, partial [Candidatus Thorarchaeota archaeon]